MKWCNWRNRQVIWDTYLEIGVLEYTHEEKKSILFSIWEGESKEGYFAMDVIDPEKYNDILEKLGDVVKPQNINYSNNDSGFEEMYKNYSIVQ